MKRSSPALPIFLLAAIFAVALPWQPSRAQPSEELVQSIDLDDRLSDLDFEHQGDQLLVVVETEAGLQRFTADEYLAAVEEIHDRQRKHGLLFVIFNITSWYGVLWVGVGLMGQVLFTGRMIVQWLVSEKEQRSVVPTAFWWMSLSGATMLILYFAWRKDIVGIIGQATGWLIYVRNLWMIYSPGGPNPTVHDDPGPEPELK